jgi:hypothetical protein
MDPLSLYVPFCTASTWYKKDDPGEFGIFKFDLARLTDSLGARANYPTENTF